MNHERHYGVAAAEDQLARVLHIGMLLDTPGLDRITRRNARTQLLNILVHPRSASIAAEAKRIFARVRSIVPPPNPNEVVVA